MDAVIDGLIGKYELIPDVNIPVIVWLEKFGGLLKFCLIFTTFGWFLKSVQRNFFFFFAILCQKSTKFS